MLRYQVTDTTQSVSVSDSSASAVSSTTDQGVDVIQDLKDGISDVVGTAMEWLPKLVLFLVIILIGWFVAKIISRAVRKLFKKINFDHFVDKSGLGAPLERAGFKDSGRFAAKIIYYLIWLFVLKIAFGALGVEALNKTFDDLITWIPKALVALILVVVGGIVANAVRGLVGAATGKQSYGNIVTKIAYFGVWIIFGLAALDQAAIASDVVETLTNTVLWSIGGILVIQFGIGGIWAARDRFWPFIYDSFSPSKPAPGQPTHRDQ